MTETLLSRPRASALTEAPPVRGLLPTALIGAAWSAAIGLTAMLLPVVVAWAADPRSASGAGAAVRTGIDGWLVAHGASLAVPGGRFGVMPLGFSVVPVLLLMRAGRVLARDCALDGLRDEVQAIGTLAAAYATIAVVLAAAARDTAVRPAPLQALFGAGLMAVAAGGCGVARQSGLDAELFARLPAPVRALPATVLSGLGILLAAGALLTTISLIAHAGTAGTLTSSLGAGAIGTIVVVLLDVAFAGNAVLWGTSYLVGAGFRPEIGGWVSPYSVHAGRLPALPLLSAVPAHPAPVIGVAGLLLTVGAGVVVGVLINRQLRSSRALSIAGWVAATVACCGMALAIACWLAGGAAGPGHLADVGPAAWRVALFTTGELALGAIPAALLCRWRGWH